MICSLKDIMVVSDMDGTLLTNDQTLLECNLETIKLFTKLGGHFSVATGRIPESVENYAQLLPYLAPGITHNGCVIYDFASKTPLATKSLPEKAARQVICEVMERFPHVGLIVYGTDLCTYLCNANTQTGVLFADEHVTYRARPLEEVPHGWIKAIFAGDGEVLAEIEAFVRTRTCPGISFVMSSPIYFELLPEGVNKGTALGELCEKQGFARENSFAIGDYYNDEGMLRAAGHAVAMENAPTEIRLLADEVTGNCEDGGVGQFLYKLIQLYG